MTRHELKPEKITHPLQPKGVRKTVVLISYLKRSDEVAAALKELGFDASIYRSDYGVSHGEESMHQSVWIGSRVPADSALLALKTVIQFWPHLCYFMISSGDSDPPGYIHDQLFFGGATSTAKDHGLRPWAPSEISALPDQTDLNTFHSIIHRKYGGTHV